MEFYIAREPTPELRSLILELAPIRFSYQKGLFELPLYVRTSSIYKLVS